MADQQLYKVKDVEALLGVEGQTIRGYTSRFGQHLSPQANPEAGRTRYFTETDVRKLVLIRDLSATRAGDVSEKLAEAVADGRLPDMPEAPITKGQGVAIVQSQQREWLQQRAGLQREKELLEAQIERLQKQYDDEHDGRLADMKASAAEIKAAADEVAALREKLGRAEGALEAYKEIMAAQAQQPAAPTQSLAISQAETEKARRRWPWSS